MNNIHKYALLATMTVGLLGTAANAQSAQLNKKADARVEYATLDSSQNGFLQLADWDDHRRCDGDHDRDDRGCYNRDYDRYRYGRNGNYSYGNYGYTNPYYGNGTNNGWYDRNGRWHAYKNRDRDRDWDRDRDRDRERHGRQDDDDRRW